MVELNICIELINRLEYDYPGSYTYNQTSATIDNVTHYRFILELFYSNKLQKCKKKINRFFRNNILDIDSMELIDNKRYENILEEMRNKVTNFKIYSDFMDNNIEKINIENHRFKREINDIICNREEDFNLAKQTLSIKSISNAIELHITMTLDEFYNDIDYVEDLILNTEYYMDLAILFYNHKKSLNVPIEVCFNYN